MRTNYVNNIPIVHGELTVVMSDQADEIVRHSSQLAMSIRDAGVNVLVINTGMPNRRFREEAEAVGLNSEGVIARTGKKCRAVIHTSVRGNLAAERDSIDQLIDMFQIGVVIVTSWEWTSSSYLRKSNLTYYLREVMDVDDVAVVVYSQSATKPVRGRYDRGGIGKLAMLAYKIVQAGTSEATEAAIGRPTPLVSDGVDQQEAERSAQLLLSKVNELAGAKVIRGAYEPPDDPEDSVPEEA